MILVLCPNPSIDCYAWMDRITPGRVNRIKKLREYPGGKGIHVALALAELGGKINLFGCWAGGAGDWIKKNCQQKMEITGIHIKGNNRKCYTFRSKTDFANTEILEPGPSLKEIEWQILKKSFETEISKANMVCLSGSWPKHAPEDAYYQLIKIAEKQRKKVFLDCTGKQLEEALKTSFFALHLNEKEAYQLCGSTDLEILLKKIGSRVELVALSRGEKGLLMHYKGKTIQANVTIDKVISTVGSGDCLTAGIAWAFHNGLLLKEIAGYGVACGAANCINEELGILKKEDVEKLLPKVKYSLLK